MHRMEIVQQQIDITRHQIINQLQDEIVQFQHKMTQLGDENNGYNVYQSIISKKRALIQQLLEISG